MRHDPNSKNLILDYPHQAISFFAAAEARAVHAGARILSIRDQHLQERLSERFRELGIPLLVECGPTGGVPHHRRGATWDARAVACVSDQRFR
jgi:hypothetical protein